MSRKAATIASAVAMIALVAAAVSACGGSSTSGGGGGAATKKLELIVGTKNDNFYVTMQCGAKQEAARLGAHLTVTGPADFTSNNAALGITRITSNNAQGGALAADQLAKQIGDKGTVAVISVKKGTSTTDARVQGFEQEMKTKHPNIKVLAPQYDDTDSATVAAGDVQADISAHPDLSGVFAANVVTAQGAATGVKSAGKSGKVKVATFDADPQQMQMLSSGTIQLAIAQAPALEGKDAVDQAMNALTGKPVTKNILTPLVAITQSNMNDPKVKPYVYKASC